MQHLNAIDATIFLISKQPMMTTVLLRTVNAHKNNYSKAEDRTQSVIKKPLMRAITQND